MDHMAFDLDDWIAFQAQSRLFEFGAPAALGFARVHAHLLATGPEAAQSQSKATPRALDKIMDAAATEPSLELAMERMALLAPSLLGSEAGPVFAHYARESLAAERMASDLIERGEMDMAAFGNAFGGGFSAGQNAFGQQFALALAAQDARARARAAAPGAEAEERFQQGQRLLPDSLAALAEHQRAALLSKKPSAPRIESVAGKLKARQSAAAPSQSHPSPKT